MIIDVWGSDRVYKGAYFGLKCKEADAGKKLQFGEVFSQWSDLKLECGNR